MQTCCFGGPPKRGAGGDGVGQAPAGKQGVRSSFPLGRRPTGASGGRGGKPLPDEAGSPRAPVGFWSLPPAAAASIPLLRGTGSPAEAAAGPRSAARLRVAGCPSPPSPGAGEQRCFNLAFMCHRVRERVLQDGANVKHLDGGTADAHGAGVERAVEGRSAAPVCRQANALK